MGEGVVGHCPISKVNIIMNAFIVICLELPVWFVNTNSSRNVLLNTISDYNFVVTHEQEILFSGPMP